MKNNIKLITRHAINNYGSLLQTMASQQVFKELGYNIQIINYISKKENLINNLKSFAAMRGLHGVKKLIYCLVKFPEEALKCRKFNKMRKKYLFLTQKYNTITYMENQFNDDILCSGGDQLWGYMPYNDLDDAYYLNFGNKTNKYISFSSSFGRYDFDEKNKDRIKNNLKKYNFVTVREKSATEFLSTIGIESTLMLDPTLLIDKSFYYQLANKKLKKGYVLVYKLRSDSKLDDYAQLLSSSKKIKIKYITNTSLMKNKKGKTYANKNLNMVLSLFKNADYIVTDSFHATVLSVIFGKEFYVHLPGKTNSRIVDFLNLLSLPDRIFEEIEKKDGIIDYKIVDEKIESMRQDNLQLLSRLLSNLE